MSILQVNASRYHPAWASLARDYLSIMSSSVSSERAFSQGGLTITKRRNRLKGDIVEALQCLKCSIRHDLLFREPGPSSVVEAECDDEEEVIDDGDGEAGWDELLTDDEDDDMDIDSDWSD
jgi:hAT family C-terminal dimerisation region